MVPRICEIFGYVGICGLACRTLARLAVNALTPGRALSIHWPKPGDCATERRVGRSPVCSEKYLTWAGAVSQNRNFSAAATRVEPLLKTTQLSGPAMVWWPPPVPG